MHPYIPAPVPVITAFIYGQLVHQLVSPTRTAQLSGASSAPGCRGGSGDVLAKGGIEGVVSSIKQWMFQHHHILLQDLSATNNTPQGVRTTAARGLRGTGSAGELETYEVMELTSEPRLRVGHQTYGAQDPTLEVGHQRYGSPALLHMYDSNPLPQQKGHRPMPGSLSGRATAAHAHPGVAVKPYDETASTPGRAPAQTRYASLDQDALDSAQRGLGGQGSYSFVSLDTPPSLERGLKHSLLVETYANCSVLDGYLEVDGASGQEGAGTTGHGEHGGPARPSVSCMAQAFEMKESEKKGGKGKGKGKRTGRGKEGQKPGKKEPGKKEPGNKEPGKKEPGNKEPGNKEPGNKEPGKKERKRGGARKRVADAVDELPPTMPPLVNARPSKVVMYQNTTAAVELDC